VLGQGFFVSNPAKFSCTLREHDAKSQNTRHLPAHRAVTGVSRHHACDIQHSEPPLKRQIIEIAKPRFRLGKLVATPGALML
jgi:hypothetical protein